MLLRLRGEFEDGANSKENGYLNRRANLNIKMRPRLFKIDSRKYRLDYRQRSLIVVYTETIWHDFHVPLFRQIRLRAVIFAT